MNPLTTIFERVGDGIQRHPILSLAVAVLLIGVAVGGAAGLTSVSGDSAFVREDPTLADYTSSFDRGTVAVLVQGDPTDPATMRAIDRFDRRMSGVEHVETVLSPADRVRRQYGRVPDSRAALQEAVSPDESTVIRVVLAPDLSQDEQTAVYRDAVEARGWAQFPAGTAVTVTGNPAFDAQLNSLIQSSTRTLLGLAVGLMVVALHLLFRGVRLRVLPIVAVFIGVVYTFGAMGYLGIPNSTLTSAVFPILIGLGIDYSVQIHQRYEEELHHHEPREALPRALAGIGPPVLIAMFAATLGFAATWVTTTEMPAFVWFAQTSIVGILLSFLTAILVLLPVLTLYVRWRDGHAESDPDQSRGGRETTVPAADGGPEKKANPVGAFGRHLGGLSRTMATHPGVVIAVAGVLFAGGFYASTTLDIVADTEEFVPDDLPALFDLQQFRSQTGGGDDVRYPVLVSGTGVTDPATLRWMEEFESVARTQPQVAAVDSPADAIRQYNDGRLPETEAGVRRVLARMPEPVRQRYFNDGHAQMIVIGEPNLSPAGIISLTENTGSAVELSRPPPGIDAELTSSGVKSPRLTYDQIVDRNSITGLGLAFVFGLLVLYYRHPVKATAPLVPIVFVIGWQGLYMSALGIEVSPLGASLGALTVGIGAEYTIIVMERYYEEKRAGAAPLDAIETAAQRVGKAITVSGMTTVFGFSALLLSPFPIVSDFGFLTLGVIFFTLVGVLLVMPPTLVLLDELAADVDAWRRARRA